MFDRFEKPKDWFSCDGAHFFIFMYLYENEVKLNNLIFLSKMTVLRLLRKTRKKMNQDEKLL